MSRRTSDVGDELAKQDGFNPKETTWKASEPDFSLDAGDAKSSLPARISAGDKRFLDLTRNMGGVVATGSAGNKMGFVTGRMLSDYGAGNLPGSNFAAVLTADPARGIVIWVPDMMSGDAFQWANRGGNGGKKGDDNDGYLLAEDPRNKEFSIVTYTGKGLIPKDKVWQAYNDGLVPQAMAQPFFAFSAGYNKQVAADKAKADADKRAQVESDRAVKQAERDARRAAGGGGGGSGKGRKAVELTVFEGGTAVIGARTGRESASDDGPHPGEEVAGLDFMDYSDGESPGKLGLPAPILSWDENTGDITPGQEEYQSVLALAKQGDPAAIAALRDIGITNG